MTKPTFHDLGADGQQVVLEALRGFDDADLVAAAPNIHDLLRDRRWPTEHQ